MCIWLESQNNSSSVVDINPENLDWFGTSGKQRCDNTEDEPEIEQNIHGGLYESVLLHYRSYRYENDYRG